MSILSHLLQFSSLNKDFIREQRPNSVCSRFLQQQSCLQRCRKTLSKSLNKINLQLGQKVNPKAKVFHKVFLSLGNKVRKSYYELFVRMQSLNKSNVCTNKMQQKIEYLDQAINVLEQKIYEKQIKNISFTNIKLTAIRKHHSIKIVSAFQNIYLKSIKQHFMYNLKNIYKESLKLQIFCDAVSNILSHNYNYAYFFSAIRRFTSYNNNNKSYQITKQYRQPFKQIFTLLTIQQINQTQQSIKITSKEFPNIQNQTKQFIINQYQDKQLITSQAFKKQLNSPQKIKNKMQIINKAKTVNNISPLWKPYSIKLDINDTPFTYDVNVQIKPKQYNKLNSHNIVEEMGDIYDKNNIFLEFQSINKSLPTDESSFKHIDFQQFDRYRIPQSSKCQSQIVYEQNYIPSDPSYTSFLPSCCSKNDYIFGNEAVNFKNSIINEREHSNHGFYPDERYFLKSDQNIRKIKDGKKKNSQKQYLQNTRKINEMSKVTKPKCLENLMTEQGKNYLPNNLIDRKLSSFNKNQPYEINKLKNEKQVAQNQKKNNNHVSIWSGIKISKCNLGSQQLSQRSNRESKQQIKLNGKRHTSQWQKGAFQYIKLKSRKQSR